MAPETRTDHSEDIARLRESDAVEIQVAADLLELHDWTSLSLDDWHTARTWVESLMGHPLEENHA